MFLKKGYLSLSQKVTSGLYKNKTFFCLFFQVSICLQRGIWPAHRNFLSSQNCILRQIPSLLKNSCVILPSCLFCNSTVFFLSLSLLFFFNYAAGFWRQRKGNTKEKKPRYFKIYLYFGLCVTSKLL